MASELRSIFVAAFAFFATAVPATAQQSVLLQIRPHVGDTLHVRLDQEVTMTGKPAGCGSQVSALRARPRSAPSNCGDVRSMSTRMEVYSRAIVQRATRDATELVAITDSVLTTPGGGKPRLKQPFSRNPVELRITSDGSVEVGAGQASDEVRDMFLQMPATLSRKPLSAGEKWIHEMRVPLPEEPGATGLVRTTLQLDSLGKGGDVAYISMHGVLSHSHSDGSHSDTSGSLTGAMQLDRKLAWITETHATIDVWTTVSNSATGKPMDVHTQVVQNLKVTSSK